MAQVTLRGIRKNFNQTEVIKGIDLDVHDGEFLVFVGPSGCGKSTTLRMIAGLEGIDEGELLIDGVRANEKRPHERGAAMVFQSYALYPHMTVAENMGFSLKMAGVDKPTRNSKVGQAAEVLRISHMLGRYPKELSGGERQRVAIGRAIVRKPKVFLFDEPLSNLDAALRVDMRIELTRLHRELGSTMIYVTHDQVEAMTMGDRIAVFNGGRVEQLGAPGELYHRPGNEFVAAFLGSPRINFFDAPATGVEHPLWHALANSLPPGATRIGLRPEHMHVTRGADGISANVVLAEHLGDSSILHLQVEGVADLVHAKVGSDYAHCQAGQALGLLPDVGKALGFDGAGRLLA
jgi:multiple sugar transport system ATP-binding protein